MICRFTFAHVFPHLRVKYVKTLVDSSR